MDTSLSTSKNREQLRKAHALNNYNACLFLNDAGAYPDWVVTTAFYSALHFIKYKAFPLKIDNQVYQNFDEYHADHRGYSKHKCLLNITRSHLKPVAVAYKELYERCHSARYVDYRVTQQDADEAIAYLEEVKRFCNTNKPAKK